MQFLGVPPGAAVAEFPQMFDHQPHVIQIPYSRLWMPKPKAFRVIPDQCGRPLDQFLRRGRRCGTVVQFIRGAAHVWTLRTEWPDRKGGLLAPCATVEELLPSNRMN